ncbi:helix-turn-helix domain-containing protein, partial [Methylobacterium marchantiae]
MRSFKSARRSSITRNISTVAGGSKEPISSSRRSPSIAMWDGSSGATQPYLVRCPLDVVAMEVVHPRVSSEAVVAKPVTPDPEPRMDAHQNARTTPHSRRLIVERLAQGWAVSTVALALGIDPKTVRKWRDRFAAEGVA